MVSNLLYFGLLIAPFNLWLLLLRSLAHLNCVLLLDGAIRQVYLFDLQYSQFYQW